MEDATNISIVRKSVKKNIGRIIRTHAPESIPIFYRQATEFPDIPVHQQRYFFLLSFAICFVFGLFVVFVLFQIQILFKKFSIKSHDVRKIN